MLPQPQYILFVVVCTLVSLAYGSSIKGYQHVQHQRDEPRSIKLSPANNLDRQQASRAGQFHNPVYETGNKPQSNAPVLESTKRLYNEELLRRQQQQQLQGSNHNHQQLSVKSHPQESAQSEELSRQQAQPVPVASASVVAPVAVPVVAPFVAPLAAPVADSASPVVPVPVKSPVVPEPQQLNSPVSLPNDSVAPKSQEPIAQSNPIPPASVRSAQPIREESVPSPVEQVAPVVPSVPIVPVASPVAPVVSPVVPVAAPAGQESSVQSVPAPVQSAPEQSIARVNESPVVEPVQPVVRAPSTEQVAPVVPRFSASQVAQLLSKVESPVAPVVQDVVAAPAAPAVVVESVVNKDTVVPVVAVPASPVAAPVPLPASAPVATEPQQVASATAVVTPVVAAVPASSVVQQPQVQQVSPVIMKSAEDALSGVPNMNQEEYASVEQPAQDPGLVLSEPIDKATKLLIDLDEHVQKFLPADEQQQQSQPQSNLPSAPSSGGPSGSDYSQYPVAPMDQSSSMVSGKDLTNGPLSPYSGNDDPIVPPLPSLVGVEQASPASAVVATVAAASSSAASSSSSSSSSVPSSSSHSSSATRQSSNSQNQQQVINQLLDQLDALQARIQDTIKQLQARRRYVLSAIIQPLGTYVRRVRTNLERLQNRLSALQAAATSMGSGNNRPGGFVDAAAIENMQRRINEISKRIGDIIGRIRSSLTPTSAPLNNGK